MNVSMALSVVVFVVGLLMFLFVEKPGWKEVGRLMFAVGLLAALFQIHGGVAVNVFHQ